MMAASTSSGAHRTHREVMRRPRGITPLASQLMTVERDTLYNVVTPPEEGLDAWRPDPRPSNAAHAGARS